MKTIERLREIAKAATPGCWTRVPSVNCGLVYVKHGDSKRHTLADTEEDALHIATFSPDLTLALLDMVEAARGMMDWANFATRNRLGFDSHGGPNLSGPAFDSARDALSTLDALLSKDTP